MGGNFWDGARNGAISAGLNHMLHGIQKGANWRHIKKNGLEKDSRQELLSDMVKEPVETHGADYLVSELGEEKYFMLDNTGNTMDWSLWDSSMLPDHVRVLRRYHTHPLDGVVSWEDSQSAAIYRSHGHEVPSYVLRKNNVHRVIPRHIPLSNGGIINHVHGFPIAKTSDWLNGIFINLE